MRHGNLPAFPIVFLSESYSDPTYEAWKQLSIITPPEDQLKHSDPTYEAWKRRGFVYLSKPVHVFRSYL